MPTILSAFEAMDWVHALLIGGCVLGGVFVGVGIIKEAEKWSFPVLLVLIGVIIEAVFTIALFVYDENITHEQQSIILAQNDKIIALEKRLAPRVISDAQKPGLIAKLKLFGSTRFDGAMASSDGEQAEFWSQLEPILVAAGWVHIAWEPPRNRGGVWNVVHQGDQPALGVVAAKNVEVWVNTDSVPKLGGAVAALARALNDIGITAIGGTDNMHTANDDAVHIWIGVKQ